MRDYQGLSSEQIKKSRKEHGSNKITTKKKQTFLDKYIEGFDNPIILILLAALGVNMIFAIFGKVSWSEAVGIFLAILISTFVSALSEYRNENSFAKLQERASRFTCKVYRSGALEEVPVEDIVVGDIVLLESGDMIPADGTIIEGSIKVDQSALNGESREVLKTARKKKALMESNLDSEHEIFKGTVVCSGECVFEVEAVGDRTIYGSISRELQADTRQGPLMIKLSMLARSISRFGYAGGVLIALLFLFNMIVVKGGFDPAKIESILKNPPFVFATVTEAIILAIAIIVMAVPEGLPLMIAIVCALNMKKMLRNNILVRKLVGIETAGSLNILFCDKTGTITKGALEVVTFIAGDGSEYSEYGRIPERLRKIVNISITQNSSARRSAKKIIGGNATERALLKFASEPAPKRVIKGKQIPFSSERKFSAAEVSGEYDMVLIKGAPELILKNCTSCFDGGGNKRSFSRRKEICEKIEELSSRSFRMLALAAGKGPLSEQIPKNLSFVGLVGIRDDVRRECPSAIWEVRRAGVQVVMITGDKRETAESIAREAGILSAPSDLVLTSEELKKLSDKQLKEGLPRLRVVARALPQDKSRLVKIAQSMNLVTGMTGDGVNDAPALKLSDVGFAMGSGSEAAKEAGDIVILDDNFLSIKKAILYGRTIYNSIKKFVKFQLTINIAAVAVAIAGPLCGVERPLDITQILWINLIMDTLAAIAFGCEPALRKYMLEPPKRRTESIVDRDMKGAIVANGLFICAMSTCMFLLPGVRLLFRSEINFYTGYFTFFIFATVFNAFNTRADTVNLIENLSLNKGFLAIMFLICLVQVTITYKGGSILRTAGLDLSEWLFVLAASFMIVPFDLLRKSLKKG